MIYKEAQKILQKIKSAKAILINCHIKPDPDSVGSALALSLVLKDMGKDVLVVSPDKINDELMFLTGAKDINIVDYSKYDFSPFDLFIILDSSVQELVTGREDVVLPDISIVTIDHHKSNSLYGEINLVDNKKSSTAEILVNLFNDWEVLVNSDIATSLYMGIVGDTGCFMFPDTSSSTHKAAAELMEKGAGHFNVIFNLYRRVPIERVWQVGELFRNALVDEKHKFVWSAINNKTFTELGGDKIAKNLANAMLFQNIEDTDFSITIIEGEKNILWVSFRSRVSDFDTTPIAKEFGGGGHKVSSGATLKDIEFNEGVKKVLEAARKHSK